MLNEIGMLVIGAVVAQIVGVVVTVIGGYRMLAYRIQQQENIMRTVLNNGIRADIGGLHAKLDTYSQKLAAMDATCKERHRRDA